MSEETHKKVLLPSALSIYEKAQNNQLNYEDLNRNDLHFHMGTGADILIEENAIYTQNPFKFSVEDIAIWSSRQNDNLDVILQNYGKHFENTKAQFERELRPIYRPYITTDGFSDQLDLDGLKHQQQYEKILEFNRERIDFLRRTDDSLDAFAEIDHRRQNIFEILYFNNNKNLDNLLLKTYTDKLCLTNQVTVLQNYREREAKEDDNNPGVILPATYAHKQRQYSIGEVIEMLKNPAINLRKKDNRQLLIPNTTGNREVGEIAYVNWSGLQVFDIDLKFSPTFISKNLDAAEIRDILFEHLKHYPWLLAITLSTSGRALHVYTKVSRPHRIFKDVEDNIEISKYWYRQSYIQKYAAIAYVLFNYCDIDIYDEQKRKEKVIDTALARVQQGIAMNYDPNARFNDNFIDLPCQIFYHLPPHQGIELKDWLTLPEVTNQFQAWQYDAALNDETNVEVTRRQGDLKIIADDTYVLDDIKQIDMDMLTKGEKYSTRWRVCNTIMASYGDTPKARQLCHHILQSEKQGTKSQINSFIRSAVINRKEADVYMLKQLRQLGLKVMLDEETTAAIADDNMEKIRYMIEKSNYGFKTHQPDVIINLADNEYLGMRMSHIVNQFDAFKVNVIESAPNTGKTEFFKALAKNKTVCLVIPFTSTIEAKIVNDESINALFDVYYGDKSVVDIDKGRSVVMTFDKFARLPRSKYKIFDYIAIDESHLLFTSTYRLPVVSQTVENLRNYLTTDIATVKNSMSSIMSVQHLLSYVDVEDDTSGIDLPKIILMSGTITGELDYFKYYGLLNYMQIRKKHPHKKEVEFVLSKSSSTRDILIFEHIAKVLKRGGKIIHPTNSGDGYARKVVECVEHILQRKIKWEYYKRANSDEEFLEKINKDTTVDGVDLLFCSDYLSVGIDIKDIGDFEFVFSNDFTAESIEQFNNRLRSTDIHCKVFFDVLSDDGMQKSNIMNLQQIEYKANAELKNMLQDEHTIAKMQQHVNAKNTYYAVLGELFSRYFIQDMYGNIKYIQAAFEIEQFEEQYKVIARSLLYIKTSLAKKYQYDVKVSFIEEKSDDEFEMYNELQKAAKAEYDLQKSMSMIQIVEFISRDNIFNILSTKEFETVKIADEIPEDDLGLHLGYDSNSLDGKFVLSYNRKHKIMFYESMKLAMRLRKLYSYNTVQQILLSCTKKTGIVSRIDVHRYERLMRLMFDDRKSTLASHTRDMLKIAYDYVIPSDESYKLDKWEYEEMKMQMKALISKNVKQITEAELVSSRRQDNIDTLISKFIDTLFIKRVSKETVSVSYRKVFAFDSELINERVRQDSIFNKLLMDDFTEVDPNEVHDISEEHVKEVQHFLI